MVWPKVHETATLPDKARKVIYSPWVVHFRTGYLLGCSNEGCARSIQRRVRELNRKRKVKI